MSTATSRRAPLDQWQLYLNVAVVVIAWVDVRPLGVSGEGLLIVLLLVANSVVVLQRSVPDSIIRPPLRMALLVIGVVASAALLGLKSNSFATVFPFFVTGHAGFKLPARPAIGLAVATAAGCVVALLIARHHSADVAPWYLGAFTGLPVFIGQSNRGYRQAIDAAQLALQEAERATEAEARAHTLAERGRIARDVHDLLAHSLAGINMQLEVVDALLEQGDSGAARQATQKAQSLVREGLTEVGNTVHALRETTLPLQETLERMLETAGGPGDTLDIAGTPRGMSAEVGQVLVRTAQEGLTNAHKHAPGSAVQLMLSYSTSAIALAVVNGPSSIGRRSAGSESGSGLGLVGMRERVELAGGLVTMGPSPDGGWGIEVTLPT